MYRADKLYNDMMAVDTAIKQLKVEDEASLAEYFRLYTELIFNHKWIGSIYDIYSDNADIYRENGLYLHGAHEMMKDTLKLTSAFPDMQVTMRDTFAVKRDDGYKLWRYYTMSGTNKTYSICLASFSKVATYPLFLKAVTMGLYSKNVMDAFNPPFNKLNGRKAGSNNSTTASLGYPI